MEITAKVYFDIIGQMREIKTFTAGPLGTNCYILVDRKAGLCAVIDPADEAKEIAIRVEETGCEPVYIFNTHGHFDHTGANEELSEMLGLPISLNLEELQAASMGESFFTEGSEGNKVGYDINALAGGERLPFAEGEIEVILCPGHSPGGLAFRWGDNLFPGDVLFYGSIGRTDLPGGSWERILESLKLLAAMPTETHVYPGHGPATTIGEELKQNPYLKKLEV